MLVAVPLPFALASHLLARPATPLDQAAFVVGVIAFGVGVFLVLPWSADEERRGLGEDPDPPPWWPAFEREFHAYAGRSNGVRA